MFIGFNYLSKNDTEQAGKRTEYLKKKTIQKREPHQLTLLIQSLLSLKTHRQTPREQLTEVMLRTRQKAVATHVDKMRQFFEEAVGGGAGGVEGGEGVGFRGGLFVCFLGLFIIKTYKKCFYIFFSGKGAVWWVNWYLFLLLRLLKQIQVKGLFILRWIFC